MTPNDEFWMVVRRALWMLGCALEEHVLKMPHERRLFIAKRKRKST